MKKKWKKPALQVIVRNKSEETVLAACKYNGRSGASSTDNRCTYDVDNCWPCASASTS